MSKFYEKYFNDFYKYVVPSIFEQPTEGVITMKKSLIERLRQERDELEEKIVKIKKFNNSESFEYLDKEDRDLLIAQENAMVTYHQILQMRIKKRNKEY